MRAVLQRVSRASVSINKKERCSISAGLLILLGISPEDSLEDIRWLCRKITSLRIFSDNDDKMNFCARDTGAEILVVSQFTLFASTKKGNRPSFSLSAKPDRAIPLYNEFLQVLREISGLCVKTGDFGAFMEVSLCNDGPVTIILDSKNRE